LKQAGNIWNHEFSMMAEDISFMKIKPDYCCFIRHQGEHFTVILVWMDDLITFTDSPEQSDQLQSELQNKFDITS
jgi:hypothetical protein